MLSFCDVCFGYEDQMVLDHISFSVHKGNCVVLMGNNGCGKSTLLKIMNGLLLPDYGKYVFDDVVIDKKYLDDPVKSKSFHQRIGYVFQNSDAQLFSTHVYEEIAFAPSQMHLSEEEIDKRVQDILKLLDLEKLKDRAPYQLSGGEKRKVALGCVLSQNPDLLVLDEPIASLDAKTQTWLTEFLLAIKKSGKTMVIATHDASFASKIADEILVIGDDHKLNHIACKSM